MLGLPALVLVEGERDALDDRLAVLGAVAGGRHAGDLGEVEGAGPLADLGGGAAELLRRELVLPARPATISRFAGFPG